MEEGNAAMHCMLFRSKEQRVPRLQDLTMRPMLVKKTVGELEAHSNGLRFSSPNLVRDGWREKEREEAETNSIFLLLYVCFLLLLTLSNA